MAFVSTRGRDGDDVYLLSVISLCMLMAITSDSMALSLEMGAFCAGLMVRRL